MDGVANTSWVAPRGVKMPLGNGRGRCYARKYGSAPARVHTSWLHFMIASPAGSCYGYTAATCESRHQAGVLPRSACAVDAAKRVYRYYGPGGAKRACAHAPEAASRARAPTSAAAMPNRKEVGGQ